MESSSSTDVRRRAGRVANRDRAGRIEVCPADGHPSAGHWSELVDGGAASELNKLAGSVGFMVASTTMLGMPLVGLGAAIGAATLGAGQAVSERRHPRIGAALDPRATVTGDAVIRSRGDWCVVRVDGRGASVWQATVVRFEAKPAAGQRSTTTDSIVGRQIWQRALTHGSNTIGLELGQDLPATGTTAHSATWYELRIHTADGRRLGARRVVTVRS